MVRLRLILKNWGLDLDRILWQSVHLCLHRLKSVFTYDDVILLIMARLFCKIVYCLYLVNVHKKAFCTSQYSRCVPGNTTPTKRLFRCTYAVDEDDFLQANLSNEYWSLFEHEVHQNIIYTSFGLRAFMLTKSGTGLKTLSQIPGLFNSRVLRSCLAP